MSEWELELIDVPIPCTVPWETMNGDERVRFCKHCSKNVYNISDMSAAEARNLLISSEGKICISMLKRADGTVVTDECPPLLRPMRNAGRRVLSAATAALTCLFAFGTQISKAAPEGNDKKEKPSNSSRQTPACVPGQTKSSPQEEHRLGGAPVPMNVGPDWKPPQAVKPADNAGEAQIPARKFTLLKAKGGSVWKTPGLSIVANDLGWNSKEVLAPDMEAYFNHVLRKLKHNYQTSPSKQSKASTATFSIAKDGSLSALFADPSAGALATERTMSCVKHAAPFRPMPASGPASITVDFDPAEL